MPVDYSKWDALELSDDSDIEVHPNVDKRSFIRAKQNQIHKQRFERKHQIETLKYERIINDGFLKRIDGLLTALRSHKDEAESRSPDELMFQSLMESAGDPEDDMPPPRPEGVHTQVQEVPTYSKMMATLIDQVRGEVDKSGSAHRFEAYVSDLKSHQEKVNNLQRQLHARLAELEREEHSKITSESIHTGFDSSHVNKAAAKPAPAAEKKKATSTSTPKQATSSKVQAVELLNPHPAKGATASGDKEQSSGADADVDEPIEELDDDDEAADDADLELSELGKQFVALPKGDYRAYLQFISQNPSIVAESETDGLLVHAFNSQLDGKADLARQSVHQALLLQYCRSLGRDGVGLFFKRITTPNHQAQQVFLKDVNDTYDRIRTRVKEIQAQREREAAEGGVGGGVEQIQLHAVDPNTTLNITIPPKDGETEEERGAREIFETFPPGLQRALESGRLEEVNKVLGKMSVQEAEEIVGLLGEGGMLSLEEQIIDATTEEGQAQLKFLEEQERNQGMEVDGSYPDVDAGPTPDPE